jgi:hypothetical protein
VIKGQDLKREGVFHVLISAARYETNDPDLMKSIWYLGSNPGGMNSRQTTQGLLGTCGGAEEAHNGAMRDLAREIGAVAARSISRQKLVLRGWHEEGSSPRRFAGGRGD